MQMASSREALDQILSSFKEEANPDITTSRAGSIVPASPTDSKDESFTSKAAGKGKSTSGSTQAC